MEYNKNLNLRYNENQVSSRHPKYRNQCLHSCNLMLVKPLKSVSGTLNCTRIRLNFILLRS